MSEKSSINVVEGSVGENASVVQIFAGNQSEIEAEFFVPNNLSKPFSPEWLLFFQENIPLIGRDSELRALQDFVSEESPFAWWVIHGNGGVGKSRLAHELLKSLPSNWKGGFVASDRFTEEAVSRWEPSSPTLWVLDYAAAKGRKLSTIISILARRFHASSTQVRILLIERSADAHWGWWSQFFEMEGRHGPLLRLTLFAPPLGVQPIGECANTLLRAFLTAAGIDHSKSEELSQRFSSDELIRSTEGGNPLLVALMAASLGQQEEGWSEATPADLIDVYLRRELRLWRLATHDDETFSALCRVVLFTTLAAPFSYVREYDQVVVVSERGVLGVTGKDGKVRFNFTPREIRNMGIDRVDKQNDVVLDLISEATSCPDIKACLQTLAGLGISEATHWSLKPDRLGERLIEILVSQSKSTLTSKGWLPAYRPEQLAAILVAAWNLGLDRFVSTLSRLPSTAAISLLTIASKYGDTTVRQIFATVWLLAVQLRTRLPKDYLDIFVEANFQERFDPIPRSILGATYRLAEDTIDSAHVEEAYRELSDAGGSVSLSLFALWLIPRSAKIANLNGEQLSVLFEFLAKRLPASTIYQHTTEIVAVADFLDACVLDELDRIEKEETNVFSAGNFVKAAIAVHEHIDSAAERFVSDCAPEALHRLIASISGASINLSYLLLYLGNRAKRSKGAAIHLSAGKISEIGLKYLQMPSAQKDPYDPSLYTCMRNYLSGYGAANVKASMLGRRLEYMQFWREHEKSDRFMEVGFDGLKIAIVNRDFVSFRRLARMIEKNIVWASESVVQVLEEENKLRQTIFELLEQGHRLFALRAIRFYGALLNNAPRQWVSNSHFDELCRLLLDQVANDRPNLLSHIARYLERAATIDDPSGVGYILAQTIGYAVHVGVGCGEEIRLQFLEWRSFSCHRSIIRGWIADAGPLRDRKLIDVVITVVAGAPTSKFSRFGSVIIVESETGSAESAAETDFYEQEKVHRSIIEAKLREFGSINDALRELELQFALSDLRRKRRSAAAFRMMF